MSCLIAAHNTEYAGPPPANLIVKFNNKVMPLPLEQGEDSKIVKFAAGKV